MVKSHCELVSTTLFLTGKEGKWKGNSTLFVRSCSSMYQITFPITKCKKKIGELAGS